MSFQQLKMAGPECNVALWHLARDLRPSGSPHHEAQQRTNRLLAPRTPAKLDEVGTKAHAGNKLHEIVRSDTRLP